MTTKVLSPKGIEYVEDLLFAMEDFRNRMGAVSPDGKASEIIELVSSCESQINDVMEA